MVVHAGRQCEVFNIVDSDYIVERVRIEVKRISVDACVGEARIIDVTYVVGANVVIFYAFAAVPWVAGGDDYVGHLRGST